jgi:hypothetical protein
MFTSKNFEFRKTHQSPEGFVTVLGKSTEGLSDFLIANNCTTLSLNYAHGWVAKNLDFLPQLSHQLEHLQILDWDTSLDLLPVESLVNLKSISLTCHKNATLDFRKLTKLDECSLHWRKGYVSIFEVASIVDFWVYELDFEDLGMMRNFKQLKVLRLTIPKIRSLKGIEQLQNINRIELNLARRLNSLEGLNSLPKLRDLSLYATNTGGTAHIAGLKSLIKISLEGVKDIGTDYSFLSSLTQLRWLLIDNMKNGIENLSFVTALKNIEFIALLKAKVLDNDLSLLLELPLIKYVCVSFRKTYYPKKDVFIERGLDSQDAIEVIRNELEKAVLES